MSPLRASLLNLLLALAAEGNGQLQRVLHFSLLLTMGDSLALLEAADL